MIADRTGTPAWTEMFLDGLSAGVTTGTAGALILGDLDFGSYQESDRWWNGQFDDIQVYDYALSANEVLGARGLGSVYTELTSQFDDIQVYDYALSANEVLGARGLGSVYTELTSDR